MKKRQLWIDNIRAFAVINMVLYHGLWDLVYIHGMDMAWYRGIIGDVWQQCICWTFILLSGFCWSFSKNAIKQGFLISVCGGVVSLATFFFSYESRIMFGVLTLIGSSCLLLCLFHKILEKLSPVAGFILMCFAFAVTYGINNGSLGIFGKELYYLPLDLYDGMLATFFGFTDPLFFSTDYFSILPWSFLYFAGYYLHKIWIENGKKEIGFLNERVPGITGIGKYSLIIYLLHQPLIYAILWIVF